MCSFENLVWPFDVYPTDSFEDVLVLMSLSGPATRPSEMVVESGAGVRALLKKDGTNFSLEELKWMLDPLRAVEYFVFDQQLDEFVVQSSDGKLWTVEVVAVVDDGHINHLVVRAQPKDEVVA